MILFALIIIFSFLLTSVSSGLDCSEYVVIDDIYQAYYADEIDYDKFILLLESIDGNLTSIADFTVESQGTTADSCIDMESRRNGRLWRRYNSDYGIKIGHDEQYSAVRIPKRKAYFSYSRGGISAMTELFNEGGRIESGKRNLIFAGDVFTIKAGNYYIDEGDGLTIGRYDYLPSAGFPDTAVGDYIHPLNGCYNGLLIRAESAPSSISLYLSQKKYLRAIKNFVGAGGNLKVAENSFGINCGYNHFAQDSVADRRLAFGVNWKRRGERSKLSAELAEIEGNPGFHGNIDLSMSGFTIRTDAWSYSAGFKNYNCSGEANDDYRSFYPAAQKIGFRSAQAGESGFGIGGGNGRVNIDMQSWWPSPSQKYHILVKGNLTIPMKEKITSRTSFNLTTLRSGLRFWLKNRFELSGTPILRCLGFRGYFLEGKGVDDEKSYFTTEMAIGELERARLYCRNRNFLDGKGDLLICCDLSLFGNYYIGGELGLGDELQGSIRAEGYFR